MFSKSNQMYLEGKKFSNGAVIDIPSQKANIINRDDYLLDLAKDKKIIHLGFVDHLPLIDKKIENGNWLHKKLIDISSVCHGIDINIEGINYIKKKYKYNNLHALDIISDKIPEDIANTHFDYILIPDVIEHIGNPVMFLSNIRERFKNNVDKIIITTPNGFRLNNFLNTFKRVEVINTDHRFWFTPYTISKILVDAGYSINYIGFYEHGRLSRRQIIRKIMLSKYAMLRDTLIVETYLK